jgi:decaprenylphospho-beta-D-erythro-pentofuranosid-2-ulose 2-reductase
MSAAPKRIAILGAASAIAAAAARLWAAQGARFALVGRNGDRLQAVAADLRARGAASAEPVVADCASADAVATLDSIADSLGGLDIVLLVYGALGEQSELEHDPKAAADLLQTNFVSAAGWCLAAANRFERQRSGALIVIGSVAGDRGRQSNYVYGASKAGLGVLVQGHREKGAALGATCCDRAGHLKGGGKRRSSRLRAILLERDYDDRTMGSRALLSQDEALRRV